MTTTLLTEPIEKKVNGVTVRLERGDLTALPADAVVFYARENLALGSGLGTAIQSRGGDAVKKQLAAIGSIGMGEAAVTSGGKLKARYIIHACGPKFQEPDVEKKLRACVLSALGAAEAKGVKTVAFPPMGAGFYGVPLDFCARTMLAVIKNYLRSETPIEQIVICVIDRREFAVFSKEIEGL